MNPHSVQQEILLIANTSFFRNQLCSNQITESQKSYSLIEQLEDACWNGLLYEMFPGVIEKTAKGKRLFLWQVLHSNNSCLEMELGEYPKEIEDSMSLNSYKFLLPFRFN